MVILLDAFLMGCICGLRSMTAPAVVAWGSSSGLASSPWLACLLRQPGFPFEPSFAVGELIADKLPFIPPRTQPGPLGVRISSAQCARPPCAIPAGHRRCWARFWGALGAVAGTFAGYYYRRLLSRGAAVPDLLVALLEDLVAVGGGFLFVSHL